MKKVKAQELVEILVVAPFFIIIFGIMTEYAFAMHSRYLLTNGLKTSVGNIYSNIQADTTMRQAISGTGDAPAGGAGAGTGDKGKK